MKVFSRSTKRGFILLVTLVFMAALTIITTTMIYLVTCQTNATTPLTADINLSGLADAGINMAHRAIRDDYEGLASSPGSRTGVADLRGATAVAVNAVSNVTRITYIDASSAVINNTNQQAILSVFDSNYTNTDIKSIELHAVASTTKTATSMQLSYTTDGTNYTTVAANQALTTSLVDYSVALPSSLTWPQIMSANFKVRVMMLAGNKGNLNVDAMYLRVTYGIDTLKELWATGGYATFPISLSGGSIQSIAITDEASKVHLNYASQLLLQNLLTNLSIASASTKATNIVNYRGASLTNPFDSVEELQQVTGITASDYAAIKDYVTVYSYINSSVYRLAGPRAPVNINTASFNVLKSIFDTLGLGAGDPTSLANDIITFRNSTPFTSFYSQGSATDFYDFVNGRSYLTATERNIVLDNCDASSLIPVSGYAGYNCTSTELCYAGNVFYVNALARVGTRNLRVKTLRGNGYDLNRTRDFGTYYGDTTFTGWRKENYE